MVRDKQGTPSFACDRSPELGSAKLPEDNLSVIESRMMRLIVLSMAVAAALGVVIEKPVVEVDSNKNEQDLKLHDKRELGYNGRSYEHQPEMLSGFKPSFGNRDEKTHAEHLHKNQDWKDVKHTIITQKIAIPYKVEVEKHTFTEKKVPVHIDRPVPYRVEVEKKVPVYFENKVQVQVDRPVPYPVKVPYPVEVEKKVPVYLEKKVLIDRPVPYRVEVEKKVPVFVENKVPVHVDRFVPYPVEIKVPTVHKVEVEVPKPYTVRVSKPFPVYIEKEIIKHVDRPVPVEVEKKVAVPVVHKVEVLKPYAVYVDRPVLIGKHQSHHHHVQDNDHKSKALNQTALVSEPVHDYHHNEIEHSVVLPRPYTVYIDRPMSIEQSLHHQKQDNEHKPVAYKLTSFRFDVQHSGEDKNQGEYRHQPQPHVYHVTGHLIEHKHEHDESEEQHYNQHREHHELQQEEHHHDLQHNLLDEESHEASTHYKRESTQES